MRSTDPRIALQQGGAGVQIGSGQCEGGYAVKVQSIGPPIHGYCKPSTLEPPAQRTFPVLTLSKIYNIYLHMNSLDRTIPNVPTILGSGRRPL